MTTIYFKAMWKILFTLIAVVFGINTAFNQCNTNTDICVQGTAGPYGFTTADNSVSTCLDFTNGLGLGAPNYGFIILYITSSGPLEMLIDGTQSSGFLDVAVFNIPPGVAPCKAYKIILIKLAVTTLVMLMAALSLEIGLQAVILRFHLLQLLLEMYL